MADTLVSTCPFCDPAFRASASAAQALIARLAAIVPPPRRHTTGYFGVLSSHSALRPLIVPASTAVQQEPAATPAEPLEAACQGNPAPATTPVRKSKYIPWRELLRRTFGIDLRCLRCHGHLRLIALVKEEATIAKDSGRHGLGHQAAPP